VLKLVVANGNGCAACDDPLCQCTGTPSPTPKIEQGLQVFDRPFGCGFIIVVEGQPATPQSPAVGTSLQPPLPPPTPQTTRPDLQIEASRNLGNGSLTVCDRGPASSGGGGIPGIDPANFGAGQDITDALWDFSCRFDLGTPCTLGSNGDSAFLAPECNLPANQCRQFCRLVPGTEGFPAGDTILTAQLRDVAKNIGPATQIVVRVAAACGP